MCGVDVLDKGCGGINVQVYVYVFSGSVERTVPY